MVRIFKVKNFTKIKINLEDPWRSMMFEEGITIKGKALPHFCCTLKMHSSCDENLKRYVC